MNHVIADTHAIIWFLSNDARLSVVARQACLQAQNEHGLFVSAITSVEMQYLVERQRIPAERYHEFLAQIAHENAGVQLVDVDRHVAESIRRVPRSEVRDMPDRIIAATALHLGVPLVSRDRKIRASSVETIW